MKLLVEATNMSENNDAIAACHCGDCYTPSNSGCNYCSCDNCDDCGCLWNSCGID